MTTRPVPMCSDSPGRRELLPETKVPIRAVALRRATLVIRLFVQLGMLRDASTVVGHRELVDSRGPFRLLKA